MQNPLEILKESEKEFDCKFEFDFYTNTDKDVNLDFEILISKQNGSRKNMIPATDKELKSHLTSLTIKLLEGEKTRLSKKVKTYNKTENLHFTDKVEVDNYNQAIYESLDFIESQLSEIKQNK